MSQRDAIFAGDLRRLIETDGGFTLALRTGRPVHRGVSVCVRPSRSLSFAWDDWSDDHVGAWLIARAGERNHRALHIGGWLDPLSNRVWLDLVGVLAPPLRRAACVIARALDQHGVYDLGRRELVIVGEARA